MINPLYKMTIAVCRNCNSTFLYQLTLGDNTGLSTHPDNPGDSLF